MAARAGHALAVAALAAAMAVPAARAAGTPLSVTPIFKSSRCASGDAEPSLRYFRNREAARSWLVSQIDGTAGDAVVPEGMAYIALSAGTHPTTGYGVRVDRRAIAAEGGVLVLQTRWARPDAGDEPLRMQVTPCLLLGVPPGDYTEVRAVDRNGRVRVKAEAPGGD